MNATLRHDQVPQSVYASKGALLKSTLFHIALFTVTAFGMPFIAKETLTVTPPINVEILTIDEISQTNRIAPPQPKKEQPKPEPAEPPKQEVKQMTADLPPDLATPKPPEIQEVDDVPPPPEPEKKAAEKKAKPKKPKAKPKAPEPKKTQEDQFASLLKNLTPDETKTSIPDENQKTSENNGSQLSQIATLSNKMTISELDALRQQIAPCWNVPAGSKYAENLVVEVRAVMNPDGTVQRASILNQSRYNQDSHFRAAADAAIRALRNPRCQPLKLPAEKYNEWKTIVINFDPREML